jgi:stage II sporulation protein R
MIVYSAWTVYSSQNKLSNDDFIRFHVIANSDSVSDQQLKLKVRDGVLAKINSELVKAAMAQDMDSFLQPSVYAAEVSGEAARTQNNAATGETRVSLDLEQSRKYIQDNLKEIESTAERIIAENGYDYTVKAELGVKWIPRKAYGEVVFPSGNYETLNITIGEGEGQNWWCVLFPPLCLIGAESDDDKKSAEEAQELYKDILLDHKYDPLMQEYDEPTTLKLKFKTLELLDKQKQQPAGAETGKKADPKTGKKASADS